MILRVNYLFQVMFDGTLERFYLFRTASNKDFHTIDGAVSDKIHQKIMDEKAILLHISIVYVNFVTK